jgi:uncharacterized protein
MKCKIAQRSKIFVTTIVFALIYGSSAASAQTPLPKSLVPMPDEQLFGFIGKDPLPPGTLPWQLLRQVKLVESKAKDAKPNAGNTKSKNATTWLPEFSAQLKELDKQEVKLYGFVLPLSTSAKQKHFLISPLPSHCPFCVSQGPDSMVEVIAKTPVEFNQWEPIVVSGKLELVNDQYLFFRLTNAESIKF